MTYANLVQLRTEAYVTWGQIRLKSKQEFDELFPIWYLGPNSYDDWTNWLHAIDE